ncbi:MAG: hypothetical protein Q9207_005842 [Kuettlingeria erythrocarpa]
MAFGWSIGDIVLLSNLAWKTIQNTRNACGEHHELTSELLTFHTVLKRLEREISKPESPLNSPGDSSKEDVERIVSGCRKPLSLLNKVVEKYNLLSQEEKSLKKLWLQVRFGNGEVANTRDIRDKISSHTSALTLYLNLVSTGSIGRVEKQMEDAGSDLREVKKAVNNLTARLAIGPHSEGSVLTTRTNDDKAVWKEFRRSLLNEGFDSSFLKKHRSLIEAYLRELGERGVLDDPQHSDETIGVSLAPDFNSNSPKQSNPAACGEATDTELGKEDQSRSVPPALEDTDDSMESSSSVSVGTVYFRRRNITPDGKPQRGDSFDCHGSRISRRTGTNEHFSGGWTSTNLRWWRWHHWNPTISAAGYWNERRRTVTSAIETRYQHQQLHRRARVFVANPWGICIILHGIDISTLVADFEYMVLSKRPLLDSLGNQFHEKHLDTKSHNELTPMETVRRIPRLVELLREAGSSKRAVTHNDSLTFGRDDLGLTCTAFLATDFTDKSTLESLTGPGPTAIMKMIWCWMTEDARSDDARRALKGSFQH